MMKKAKSKSAAAKKTSKAKKPAKKKTAAKKKNYFFSLIKTAGHAPAWPAGYGGPKGRRFHLRGWETKKFRRQLPNRDAVRGDRAFR
jgi:hypothetical protein